MEVPQPGFLLICQVMANDTDNHLGTASNIPNQTHNHVKNNAFSYKYLKQLGIYFFHNHSLNPRIH